LGLYRNELVDHVLAIRGADKIVIIHTEGNEEDLERIRSDVRRRKIPFVSKKVPPWNFNKVLSDILEVVIEHEDYEVEYGISCGTRVMTAAAFRAALYTDSLVFFMTDPDKKEMGKIIHVEPISVTQLSQQKKKILNKLKELGGFVEKQSQLGSRNDLSAASISKHISNLASSGFVKTKKTGRGTQVQITDLGRTVSAMKEYNKGKVRSS
jgi:CRISPR locus-related DNA-binding protein